jgi:uncharacterized SAM-binding protein YcdF (DUF218 family)
MENIIFYGIFLALFVFSLPVVSGLLARLLETTDELCVNGAQAIVVLGGGLRKSAPEYDYQPTVSSRTLERLRYAALLSRKTGLPVLVSGGHVLNALEPSEAEIMTAVLEQEFNVSVRWQENKSRNTRENAQFCQQILSAERIERILLVTHAFHMRRAMNEFKRFGFEVQPAATVFFSNTHGKLNLQGFIPASSALMLSSLVIHECLGMLWYQLLFLAHYKP